MPRREFVQIVQRIDCNTGTKPSARRRTKCKVSAERRPGSGNAVLIEIKPPVFFCVGCKVVHGGIRYKFPVRAHRGAMAVEGQALARNFKDEGKQHNLAQAPHPEMCSKSPPKSNRLPRG